METIRHRIYIQAEGVRNDLVVELFEGEKLIPYCCKMMENNMVPGLLSMRHQMLDGVYILKYNVSGKWRLQDYLMQQHLSHEKGLLLLRNLTDSLLQLGEYFLATEQCILDPQQIFVGDGMRTYLICLPLEKETNDNATEKLQNFYEKLLSDYFATAECSDYDEMFKWVYRADPFDLVAFRDRFLAPPAKKAEKVQEPSVVVTRERPSVIERKEAPQPAAKLSVTEENKIKLPPADDAAKAGVLNIPGGTGFAIPEAPADNKVKKPKKEKNVKNEKKKKGFWPFGSHSSDKNETKDQNDAKVEAAAPQDAAAQNQKGKQEHLEDWEEGTICVAEDEGTIYAGDGLKNCYLMHGEEQIPVTKLPFVIGKYNTSVPTDYAIRDNRNISRRHATILMEGDNYMLKDNTSLNGTFLNGKRLYAEQLTPLKEGDEIRLYNEVFIFHLN